MTVTARLRSAATTLGAIYQCTPRGRSALSTIDTTSPAEDIPCCPSCGGDVEEVVTGTCKGMFVCVTGERQPCVRLIRFEYLDWRA